MSGSSSDITIKAQNVDCQARHVHYDDTHVLAYGDNDKRRSVSEWQVPVRLVLR